MAKKIYVATFGCRTNQADSAYIRESFLGEDFEETESAGEADVIVVNSCTVTHRSDQQVRQLSRKLRRENPGAKIVVTGCYAQREPGAIARIPGIDAVVGNTHRSQLVDIVQSLGRPLETSHAEIAAIYRDDFSAIRTIDPSPAREIGRRTRPFVKIQDGCDSHCSYCIIPSVRGPGRSVPPEAVIRQVEELTAAGFKEIVLTGIHIGTYGMHIRPTCPLDQLLTRLLDNPAVPQLRISSLEPMQLSRRVVELAALESRIAPHFHICLQSGSDRLLRLMRRPYSTAAFAEIVERVRELIPDAGIGTDLIVGFPGETENDHRQTVEFVRRMPFTYLHIFPYSARPGTPAAGMPNHAVPEAVKGRSAELRELSALKHREFRRRFLGDKLRVLTLSDTENGQRVALAGNYLRARVDLDVAPNTWVEGTVSGEQGEDLVIAECGFRSKERALSTSTGPKSGGF